MPAAKKTTSKKTTKSTPRSPKKVVMQETKEVMQTPSAEMRAPMSLGEKLKKPYVFVPLMLLVAGIIAYLLRGTYLAAIVNGQPITRASFTRQMEVKDGKAVLNSLITQKLIEQEAARQHVSVSSKELDDATKQISSQLAKQGQTLDSALAAQGMSKSDFQEQLYIQKLVEKLLANQITVTDQEVNDYIAKNKDSIPSGMSDADVKASVKQQLQQQKLNDKAQALVSQLQQKAHITTFVNY